MLLGYALPTKRVCGLHQQSCSWLSSDRFPHRSCTDCVNVRYVRRNAFPYSGGQVTEDYFKLFSSSMPFDEKDN